MSQNATYLVLARDIFLEKLACNDIRTITVFDLA